MRKQVAKKDERRKFGVKATILENVKNDDKWAIAWEEKVKIAMKKYREKNVEFIKTREEIS